MNLFTMNRVRLAAAAWLLSGVPLFVGCGTAEYEAKLETASKRLKIDNKFVGLDAKETLIAAIKNDQGVGAKISFRKPEFFGGAAFAEGAANPNAPTEPLPEDRIKPSPLLNFPGFQYSYEVVSRAPKVGLQASNLYLGTEQTDPGVADQIVEKSEAAYPDRTEVPAWTTTAADTPEGGSTQWKTITVQGPQDYRTGPNGIVEQFPTTMTIWMREQGGFQVFVALRVTTMGGDPTPIKQWTAASAGTVRVVTPTKIE